MLIFVNNLGITHGWLDSYKGFQDEPSHTLGGFFISSFSASASSVTIFSTCYGPSVITTNFTGLNAAEEIRKPGE
jgi:hypothetical protein